MKIAIDITPLHTAHKDRGVGAYTKLLIEALQKYEERNSYYFFVRGQKVPDDVELIHYPYFDPFFVTLPFFYSKPTVVTVHDLIPLAFPKQFPSGIRGALKWHYQRLRLARARRIIADSACSKRDIERIAGIPASRVDAVQLAPAPQYRQISDQQALARLQKKYGLPDIFVLYVGDVNWNKNILGLMQGFHHLKSQRLDSRFRGNDKRGGNDILRKELKLALLGKAFFDASLPEVRQINAFIDAYNLGNDVIKPGGIPAEDLVAICNLASVYIQPSFYEGFGLPVLEAMACGVPVVTSRAASLAEIAGPAIVIDPTRPEDIARGLLEGLTLSPSRRSKLIRAQTQWSQRFSWERVARETIASYEKALA